MKSLNRSARFNYKILETYEAGIELKGIETKTIKARGVDLSRSFGKIIGGEAYLINASIPLQNASDVSPTRTRKLLLHKKQIITILSKIKAKKLTLIPLKVYTKGRLIKVEVALAKAKRQFEKREAIKRKDIEREIERELRGDKDNKLRK
jgi:SsrA-binding protein